MIAFPDNNPIIESIGALQPIEIWLPGSDTVLDLTDSRTRISVIPWLKKYADAIQLHPSMGQYRIESDLDDGSTEMAEQTKDEYLRNVRQVIASCARRGGKTVYSRVKAVDCTPERINEYKDSLFSAFADTYRFAFSYPSLGQWIGASPELLFHYDKFTGNYRTMAIAGTRTRGLPQPWDKKNRIENQFVVKYIVSSLAALGVAAAVSDPRTVAYGSIEHLCVDITGRISADKVYEAIDALNPTPALCGSPISDAITDIQAFEPHPRSCYGGVMLIETSAELTAFVILRACKISGNKALFFVGGGISELSDPESEWLETEAKAASLLSYMPQNKFITIN